MPTTRASRGILRSKGFCADYDLVELRVKNTNDFNDQYDIMISQGYVRRAPGPTGTRARRPRSRSTRGRIAQVRVGFFGFRCLDEKQGPAAQRREGKIPVNCFGNVTASPKNKDGHDVDSRIHGDQIQWRLDQEGDHVRVDEQPGRALQQGPVRPGRRGTSRCARPSAASRAASTASHPQVDASDHRSAPDVAAMG